MISMMDVNLAALLLKTQEGVGIPLLLDGHVHIIVRLRITQEAFDGMGEPAIVVGAGNTSFGPAYVVLMNTRLAGTQGKPVLLRFALDPTQTEQMTMILKFIDEAQIRLVVYDAALELLGERFFVVTEETRRMMWSAAESVMDVDAAPDADALINLPPDVTPFEMASYAIEALLRKYVE